MTVISNCVEKPTFCHRSVITDQVLRSFLGHFGGFVNGGLTVICHSFHIFGFLLSGFFFLSWFPSSSTGSSPCLRLLLCFVTVFRRALLGPLPFAGFLWFIKVTRWNILRHIHFISTGSDLIFLPAGDHVSAFLLHLRANSLGLQLVVYLVRLWLLHSRAALRPFVCWAFFVSAGCSSVSFIGSTRDGNPKCFIILQNQEIILQHRRTAYFNWCQGLPRAKTLKNNIYYITVTMVIIIQLTSSDLVAFWIVFLDLYMNAELTINCDVANPNCDVYFTIRMHSNTSWEQNIGVLVI